MIRKTESIGMSDKARRILGISNASDAGTCLIEDGKLVAAISEERLSREKLHLGWPQMSLDYILASQGLSLDDIDLFAYGWHGGRTNWNRYVPRFAHRMAEELSRNPNAARIILNRVDVEHERDSERQHDFKDRMARLGIPDHKIFFADHHMSHAWSAFACSPFDEAHVFTLDGRGDYRSGLVAYADRAHGVVERDDLISAFDGLGFIYGQITHYMGFVAHRHEGKVTGLAAQGDAEKTIGVFRDIVGCENGRIRCRIGPYKPFYTKIEPQLLEIFDRFEHRDLAAGLQKHCEDIVAAWIRWQVVNSARPDVRNICLAGGLFANVRINQIVAELDCVDNIYVFPHMGDGGLPVGAALATGFETSGLSKLDLPSVRIGPSFSNDDIEAAVRDFGGRVKCRRLADRTKEAVEILTSDKVIGHFEGRMEYGPRALGARSVIYHTRDRSVNEWLNARMNRTEFMPFAPVTPVEYAAQCYLGWRPDHVSANFMTRTYSCDPAFAQGHPAVVHIDGTARPQIARPGIDGGYYDILKAYCDATGERALINTSFNMHEEPIVCSPQDAIQSLLYGMIDVLLAQDCLIEVCSP